MPQMLSVAQPSSARVISAISKCVQELLEHEGIVLNAKGDYGFAALNSASDKDRVEVVSE